MVQSIVDQKYWDDGYDKLVLDYDESSVPFQEIFSRFFPNGDYSCIEIGVYPGAISLYLGKNFGYTINGIDLNPHVRSLSSHMHAYGVKTGEFFQGDFSEFRPPHLYDIVFSSGFIEHFDDVAGVIRKHMDLVKPGGLLFLACPNFRKLQYILHTIVDPENLRRHNLDAMDLFLWRDVLQQGGMTILHDGYYRTIDFWYDTPRDNRLARTVGRSCQYTFRKAGKQLNFPNRFTSPYLVSLSRKEL
jgi:SAM-dependent methyltransferase